MDNEVLEHHGILGQKWGVRRYQNYDGTLTAAGRKRLNRKFARSYNKAADVMDKSIQRINAKYDNEDLGAEAGYYTKKGQKYIKELDSAWRSTYINALKSDMPELFEKGEAWIDSTPFMDTYSYFITDNKRKE